MLTCKITLPDSPHPIIISKNPGFRALYLTKRNDFPFSRLLNTKVYILFIFCCWFRPERCSFCPKNNGFASVWGRAVGRGCSPPPAPGSYAYSRNPSTSQRRLNTLSTNTWAQVYRWLISYITALSDETPANIRMCLIFLEHKSAGLHFPTNDIGLSTLKFFRWVPEFLFTSAQGGLSVVQDHLRSINLWANRKRICDFLLVCNSNFGPILLLRNGARILHRFGDLTVFMCS